MTDSKQGQDVPYTNVELYSRKLLMMDKGKARNMYSFLTK